MYVCLYMFIYIYITHIYFLFIRFRLAKKLKEYKQVTKHITARYFHLTTFPTVGRKLREIVKKIQSAGIFSGLTEMLQWKAFCEGADD